MPGGEQPGVDLAELGRKVDHREFAVDALANAEGGVVLAVSDDEDGCGVAEIQRGRAEGPAVRQGNLHLSGADLMGARGGVVGVVETKDFPQSLLVAALEQGFHIGVGGASAKGIAAASIPESESSDGDADGGVAVDKQTLKAIGDGNSVMGPVQWEGPGENRGRVHMRGYATETARGPVRNPEISPVI